MVSEAWRSCRKIVRWDIAEGCVEDDGKMWMRVVGEEDKEWDGRDAEEER